MGIYDKKKTGARRAETLHKISKKVRMEVYFYLDLNLRLSKTKTSNRKETKEEDKKLRDKI